MGFIPWSWSLQVPTEADIYLWGTWDLSVLAPHFVGLSHIWHILLRTRAIPHTLVTWQSRAHQHHMLLSDSSVWTTSTMEGSVLYLCSCSLIFIYNLFREALSSTLSAQGSAVQPLPGGTGDKVLAIVYLQSFSKPPDCSRLGLWCQSEIQRFKTCFQLSSV